MLKKTAALLSLCIAVTLCACGEVRQADEASSPEVGTVLIDIPAPVSSEKPEPAPEPTPTWESGIAAGYGIGVLYCTADRGSEVQITGEDGDYYIVIYGDTELCVEKRFVRRSSEAMPEEHTAFAYFGAAVFPNPYLTGEPLERLPLNSTLKVLDEFGDLMLVRTDRSEGYIRSALVSPVWVEWTGDEDTSDSGQGSVWGVYTGGTDGGDLELGRRKTEAVIPVKLSARFEETGTDRIPEGGMILADGTELYLGIVWPGDELMVQSADGRTAQIYTSRGTGTLPRWAVLMANDEPYDTWSGYAMPEAKLFSSYKLAGDFEELFMNTEITVVLETDNGLFVRLSDGRYGYSNKDSVSRTMCYYEEPDSNNVTDFFITGEWTVPVL